MYKAVGQRIRQLRLKRNLTQDELSKKAAISLSFLGHIERGNRKMSLQTFVNIAQALDCSTDELLLTQKFWEMKLSTLLEIAADRAYFEETGLARYFSIDEITDEKLTDEEEEITGSLPLDPSDE